LLVLFIADFPSWVMPLSDKVSYWRVFQVTLSFFGHPFKQIDERIWLSCIK
jgi:hypothetical protein